MDIHVAYQKLREYLIANQYRGYDPYDGSNTSYRLIAQNKLPRLFSTYFNKFSPVNFRKILGISPSLQNQALAFIGRAFIMDFQNNKEEVEKISSILIDQSLKEKHGFHCWDAHGFPIQMRGSYTPAGTTDIIGNEAIGRFFLDLYEKDSNSNYRDICLSVKDFLMKELAIVYKDVNHFRYKPITPKYKWCYNASAIGASFVNAVSETFEKELKKDFISNCLKDIVDKQKPEGHWYYSLNLETGFEKPQIDFHQGFVLDAILEHMQLNGFEKPFLSSYKKGLEFYHQKQFLPNGQGIYRYPRKWPVNIHNQAQGIITFTRAAAAGFGEEYHQFARNIAEWTIKNMQDKDGHFYFLKYPLFTNKIPYIRWSDAAMGYALAVLLAYEQKTH